MGKLIRIDNQAIQDFYDDIYGSQIDALVISNENREKVEKSSINKNNLIQEDETSIYEYDYDCIKKNGFLDRLCKSSSINEQHSE